jgi:hypothetical protein
MSAQATTAESGGAAARPPRCPPIGPRLDDVEPDAALSAHDDPNMAKEKPDAFASGL